jgi:hypothetical protein
MLVRAPGTPLESLRTRERTCTPTPTRQLPCPFPEAIVSQPAFAMSAHLLEANETPFDD